MHPRPRPTAARLALATLVTLALPATLGCGGQGGSRGGERRGVEDGGRSPTFVGRAGCAPCHPLQDQQWRGSHHDLAMQRPGEDTVLGDFDGARFEHFGVRSSFDRRDGRFVVETDGPDGKPTEYEVAYVFGVTPLQQYLIEFPGGRLQPLALCWDSRPADQGGQRWFHIYPDEPIPSDDVLHWTGRVQNWNYMCASCHSTHLERHYDLESDSYASTWSEIDVSCEACHGPGSDHVDWANGARDDDPTSGDPGMGLVVTLADPSAGQWELDHQTGNARRSVPRGSRAQVETCARCHSRRGVLREGPVDGRPFADSFRLSLLEEGLYHADGQILDEVYVYGSFLQSRMYREGVTCSDCHDPHTLEPLFPGDALCARCHLPARYAAPTHHHHPEGSTGARCVECHMPARTYMVVDPRHDHSLRVPRPDLSLELGTPNACNGCHLDRTVRWAADRVAEWFPGGEEGGRSGQPHFAQTLAAGRAGSADAGARLAALATDDEAPGIVRATAVALLAENVDAGTFGAVQAALSDGDPLVRTAALGVLEVLPPIQRLPHALGLLEDPLLVVRAEAGRVLAATPAGTLPAQWESILERAVGEYEATQLANAELPGSHLNLGLLYMDRGRTADAERSLRTALRLDPSFVAAHVNLADLYREQGREAEAEAVLREGLAADPNAAALYHSLGLLHARAQRLGEAVEALARAASLAPDQPRYAYVHGVALSSLGDGPGALEVLERAHRRHPSDREILSALATLNRDAGALDAALAYARKLVAAAPGDPAAQALLEELLEARGR